MKLAKLYKRATTGKTQQWEIEVEDNKYRTHVGQLDGKLITSEWTTCKGKNPDKKNATTGTQQALKEAQAKWKKKTEDGYFENVADIDAKSWHEPMLAKSIDDHPVTEFPVFVQPKLDGIRCIIAEYGAFSRNGKPFSNIPHITNALGLFLAENPEEEFDGELYNHDLRNDFDSIVSHVRKTKPSEDDIKAAADVIQYWIYDLRDPELVFTARNEVLKSLADWEEEGWNGMIKLVPTYQANNQEELDEYKAVFIEQGFEGMMVRKDTPYEFKRTVNLLKCKDFVTEEFLILDITEGVGNRSGMAGKMHFKTKEDKPFEANIRGGNDYYRELLKNKEDYINKKLATVTYQNLTPDGIPRFPVVTAVRDYE